MTAQAHTHHSARRLTVASPPFLFTWRKAVASVLGPHPTTRAALLALSLWMDTRGECYPGIEAIAAAAGLNEKTARRRLADAEAGGWVVRRRRGLSGQGWCYGYAATLPPTVAGQVERGVLPAPWAERTDSLPVPSEQRTDFPSPKNGLSVPEERTLCPVKSLELSKKSIDAFEHAWSLYPRRSGGNPKKAARRAWDARLRAGATAEDLAAGVRRYAAYVRAVGNEGTPYVKQASSFFGPDEHWKEAWEPPIRPDEPASPQPVVVYD